MEFDRISHDKNLAETFLCGFKRNLRQGLEESRNETSKCQISPSDSVISPSLNSNGWSEAEERETISSVYSDLDEESDGIYVVAKGEKIKLPKKGAISDYAHTYKMIKPRAGDQQISRSIKDSIKKFESRAGNVAKNENFRAHTITRANDPKCQIALFTSHTVNRPQYPRVKEPNIINKSIILPTRNFGESKRDETLPKSSPIPINSAKLNGKPKAHDIGPSDNLTNGHCTITHDCFVSYHHDDENLVPKYEISSPLPLSSEGSWSSVSDDQNTENKSLTPKNKGGYSYSKGSKNNFLSTDLKFCKNFPSLNKSYNTLPSSASFNNLKESGKMIKTYKNEASFNSIHNTLKISSDAKESGIKGILKNFENITADGRLYRWPSTHDLDDYNENDKSSLKNEKLHNVMQEMGDNMDKSTKILQPDTSEAENQSLIVANGTISERNLKSILKKSGTGFDTITKSNVGKNCHDIPDFINQMARDEVKERANNIPKAPKLPKISGQEHKEGQNATKVINGHLALHISDLTIGDDDFSSKDIRVETIDEEPDMAPKLTERNILPIIGQNPLRKKVKSSKSTSRPKLPQLNSTDTTKSMKNSLENHSRIINGELTDDSSFYSEDNFVGIRDVTSKPVFLYSQKGTVRGVHNRVLEVVQNFVDANMAFKRKLLSSEKVVLYTTSCTAVRETYLKSKSAKALLKAMLVRYEERDCYINDRWTKDLKILLRCDSTMLPQIFVNGHNIGGYKELEKLNEAGELKEILERYKTGTINVECVKCGDFHFVLCSQCHGSKRSSTLNVFSECNGQKPAPLKCVHCEETGLVRCDNCYD